MGVSLFLSLSVCVCVCALPAHLLVDGGGERGEHEVGALDDAALGARHVLGPRLLARARQLAATQLDKNSFHPPQLLRQH